MAFLYKNKNSKNWLAGFRDATGKRRNRSTGVLALEKNRGKAQNIANEYESAARNKRTALQVRRTICELHRELTGEDLPTVTVRDHAAQWLRSKKPTVSPSTASQYEAACNRFLQYLEIRADSDLAEITREDIEGFRDHLAAQIAPKTVNQRVKVLRMLFRDAQDRALLADDPTKFAKPVKARSVVERRPFTMAEINSVLKHCDTEWRSMVILGLYTGQRLGDIARFTWKNVNLKRKTISLVAAKTGKSVTLSMPKDLRRHLTSLPTPISKEQPLHPEAVEIVTKQGRTGQLSNRFAAILAEAGLREKKSRKSTGKGRDSKRDTNELSFHSLRRSTATILHEAGVPLYVAMALLGHDSADVHAAYVTVGEEALKDAAKRFPQLDQSAFS